MGVGLKLNFYTRSFKKVDGIRILFLFVYMYF